MLLGSRWSPSLFHVTVLSGDDDLQSTVIESPGCKYERAGSSLIDGTTGTTGSNPFWDATILIWHRKIAFYNPIQKIFCKC